MNGSEVLRAITGALGGYHPMRLTLGLALGVVAKMAVAALASTYPETKAFSALNSFEIVWFMAATAPLPFVPIIFSFGGVKESVAHQIRTINALLDAEGAPEAQRALVWRSITTKYLETIQPDLSKGTPLKDVLEQVKTDGQRARRKARG